MVTSVFEAGINVISRGISFIGGASTYCSPWTIAATIASAIAIPRIFKACRRPPRQQPPVPVQVSVQMDQVQPGNIFLNPARRHQMLVDQETLVTGWERPNETREVYVLRTVQRDLICQVFDKITGKSNRYYIGERGEYSQKEAEEFIRNRVPWLVNSRNGASAIFLCVHERVLHVWQTALHEIFLAHNENDDKIDWIVSFINEARVERVAMGIARKFQHMIPFWQRNVPQIALDATGIVSVNFPNAVPPNPMPVVQQAVPPLPNEPMFQELSEHPRSFSVGDIYIDNIPVKTATKNGSTIVLGYVQKDSWSAIWSYAPFQDGSVLQIDGIKFSPIFCRYCWREKPILTIKPFETSFTDQASVKNGVRHYESGKDQAGREYVLIPANGGWVPVRHPTDPSCGNWLSKTNLTKIVYDSNQVRWPGCDIDYHQHGFIPQDENNKTWWPVKSGPYKPSFSRLKAPYYPDFRQLDRESSRPWLIAQVALAAYAINFGYTATLAAAEAAKLVKIALNPDPMNFNGVANGVNLGYQGAQILAPLVMNEARANDQMQARAVREYVTQTEVLETLDKQDAYDRGEEVVKAVSVADISLVQELLQGGPIYREPRYQAVVLAASSGYPNTLRALIERTEIDARILKAAQFAAKENGYGSVLAVLREYRNQERVVPR